MSEKIYAWLLRLYPSHFREAHGDEALQLFRDRARDELGFLPGLRLWMDLLADLAMSLPREYSYVQQELVGAPAQHRLDRIPSFHVLEVGSPRIGALLFGGVLTLAALGVFPVLMNHSGDDRPRRASVREPQPPGSPSSSALGVPPQPAAGDAEAATAGETTTATGLARPDTATPGDSQSNSLTPSGISPSTQPQAPKPGGPNAPGATNNAAACAPVPGADQIWSNPSLRWVLIGESHGSNETPAAFYNLVCDALAKGKHVTVALEHPSDEQAALEGILTARDPEPARSALLSRPSWRDGMDGRASEAMLRLLLSLRSLRRDHSDLAVVAFDVPITATTTPAAREQGIARKLLSLASANPGHLILVLAGSLHAVEEPRFGHDMAAMYLPAKERLSLEVTDRGGEAWGRSPDGCGPMKADAAGKRELTPCGIFLNPGLAPDGKYDGILSLGAVLTPSAPAAGIPSPLPPCRVKFLAVHQATAQH